MKKRKQFRQGDVLIDFDNPPTALGKKLPREAGRVVLAHGEATGHTHSIGDRGVSLFALENNRATGESAAQAIARIGGGLVRDRALETKRPVALVHQEHDPIKLPAGTARVIIQRTYEPAGLRSVAD